MLSKVVPEWSKAAKENGVAVLVINNSHHITIVARDREIS